MSETKKTTKKKVTKKDGFSERRPIESVKAFKSKDGKSFVVQSIKTMIFPVNYIGAILENDSPLAKEESEV